MKNKAVKKVILELVAAVLLVVGLTGCKEAEGTTPEATSSEMVSEVETEVISEEVAEDVSEEVVSEEVEEEVSEMPEIVDGVQVVYYDTWEKLYDYVYDYIETVDETVLVVFSFNHSENGQLIVYNGAHFTLEEDFVMTFKSSKTITSITSEKGSVLISDYDYEGYYEWDIGLYEEGTDIEVPLVITYEDGTEENFTVYITKDWKYPWEE